MANVSLSLCRRDRSRGFEFVGEQGTLRYNWGDEQLRLESSGGGSILLDYRGRDFAQMYVEHVEGFRQRRGGTRPQAALPGLECGLSAIEISCRAESYT